MTIASCRDRRGRTKGRGYIAARRLASRLTLRLDADLFDLASERLVFPHLALQELNRDSRLFLDTTGRQQVHVRRLVAAVLEVRRLDPPLVDQALQAVVDLAEAETKLLRNLTLTQLRVRLEEFKQLVTDFFGKHGWPCDSRV